MAFKNLFFITFTFLYCIILAFWHSAIGLDFFVISPIGLLFSYFLLFLFFAKVDVPNRVFYFVSFIFFFCFLYVIIINYTVILSVFDFSLSFSKDLFSLPKSVQKLPTYNLFSPEALKFLDFSAGHNFMWDSHSYYLYFSESMIDDYVLVQELGENSNYLHSKIFKAIFAEKVLKINL